MILDGVGGGSTTTGNVFEKSSNVFKSLSQRNEFDEKNGKLLFENEVIAEEYNQHNFYTYLTNKGIDWEKIVSKKLLPDNAIITNNKVLIFEVKYQQVAGSVDEKLQTCDFKKKQYQKLCKDLGKKVIYAYVLNDWFKNEKYKDTLDYIESMGCFYFFNEVPLEFIFD
jgi:hypothetical protein